MKKSYLIISMSLLIAGGALLLSLGNVSKNGRYTPRTVVSKEDAQGFAGALEYLKMLKNNQITGDINPDDILNAKKQLEKLRMKKGAKSLNLNWVERGPDNVGGRTRAILVDKNNPNVVYAGAVSGGLWKSTTAGTYWTKVELTSSSSIHGNNENLAISCIAQAPNGDIYVGTGEGLAMRGAEGEANGGTAFIGQGMWKLKNGESSFTQLANTVPQVTNSKLNEWCMINRIGVNPNNSDIVYAATNKGLRISSDGGANWTNPISSILSASDIDVAKVGDNLSIAAVVGTRVYLSTDGTTFQQIQNGLGLPTASIGRIEIAIAPSDPDYMYAQIATTTNAFKGVYRTKNKGASWDTIGIGGSALFNIFGANDQGDYDNIVAVYPNNKNKIIAGGVDMWGWEEGKGWENKTLWNAGIPGNINNSPYYVHADHHAYVFHPTNPDIIYVGSDGGVNKSVDGGTTWTTINKNYCVTQFYTTTADADGKIIGGTQDNGTLYIDKSGNTDNQAKNIYGGDGSWACASSIINPKFIIASTYYGKFERSDDNGETFSSFANYDFTNAGVNGTFAAFVAPLLLWESTNNTNSIDSVNYINSTSGTLTAGTKVYAKSANNQYPIEHTLTSDLLVKDTVRVQDVVSSKLFFGANGAVWMTKHALNFAKDPGTNQPKNRFYWYKVATISGSAQTMAYTNDGDHLFVGCSNGNIYRIDNLLQAEDSVSANEASTGSVVAKTLIASYGRPITSISVDPSNSDNVLITLGSYGYSTYVYYSTNALSTTPTFSSKQGDLPQMPVYASIIKMWDGRNVIIGTEMGVFATEDITATNVSWTEENANMGNVPVYALYQQEKYRDAITISGVTYPAVSNWGAIYAGTHGRGIFECRQFVTVKENNNSTAQKVFNPTVKVYPNPVYDKANIEYVNLETGNVNINIFDLSGKVVRSINLGTKGSGLYHTDINCSTLEPGTYIVSLTTGTKSATTKLMVYR